MGELGDIRDDKVVATSSPEFVYHDKASGTIVFGDSSFWKDPIALCRSTFECVSDLTTGWKDNSSFRVSTRNVGDNNGNNSCSWIHGGEISDIEVGGRYRDYTLNLYYAYGIRNSFGFTFDPVTGKMWDSENGPDYGIISDMQIGPDGIYILYPMERYSKLAPISDLLSSKYNKDDNSVCILIGGSRIACRSMTSK